MKIELKSIKVLIGNSQETFCYTANLFKDGKKVAMVSNSGHGGCDSQHPVKSFTFADIKEINQWLKNQSTMFPNDKGTFHLEAWCSEQVSAFLIKRDVKRKLSKKCIYVQPNGEMFSISLKNYKKDKKVLFQHIIKKYAGVKILNTMPIEEAIEHLT